MRQERGAVAQRASEVAERRQKARVQVADSLPRVPGTGVDLFEKLVRFTVHRTVDAVTWRGYKVQAIFYI